MMVPVGISYTGELTIVTEVLHVEGALGWSFLISFRETHRYMSMDFLTSGFES